MTSRNPFRIRSFQRASGDDQFVRLFASSALDVVEGGAELWETLQYLRSAPGGGKTSLLRLITPGPLRKVGVLAARDARFRKTSERLQALGALKDGRPTVLGIILSFSHDYRDLDDLGPRAPRVFRALFTARVVLATLRALLEMGGKNFPDDLSSIRATWTPSDGATIPADATGDSLRAWASEIEDSAYEVLDELGPPSEQTARSMIGFDGLHWLASAQFEDDGVGIDTQPVLLLDELQELSIRQREALNEALTALRKPLGIWVAERLQALQPNDLLAVGVREGRDYQREIRLEERWRGAAGSSLQRFLGEIADLRVDQADGFQGRSFFPLLASERRLDKWAEALKADSDASEASIVALASESNRYDEWIKSTRSLDADPLARSVAWRTLQILIHRDLAREQSSFDFDALQQSELEGRATNAIQSIAELAVCKDTGVPYYFGPERLAQLSSANVDQFIELAGDLFEEVMSAHLLRRNEQELSAERQQEILIEAARRKWKEIPRGSVRGHAVLRFLESMAQMCSAETYRETAPYAPGVTGIGIMMEDRDLLVGERNGGAAFSDLTEVLSSCVALNILEPWLDRPNKGQRWLVLYFNRLLCVHHRLPLGYGGWRPQKLPILKNWITGAPSSPKEESFV